jgi:FlaA1/EpsC-like NDP-sugar epimerase
MKYSMIETILVTGATGTVGSEVVKQLSKEDKKDINIIPFSIC